MKLAFNYTTLNSKGEEEARETTAKGNGVDVSNVSRFSSRHGVTQTFVDITIDKKNAKQHTRKKAKELLILMMKPHTFPK